MQEVLHYKHHLEGIVLQEVLGNPELHVTHTFLSSVSHLCIRADIARKIHEPPVGKPQIVVHAECKLRLAAKLGNIEMIYILMIVEDTRREVRIPDSKRRRHTDVGSIIAGMGHRGHRLQKHTRMVHLVVRLVPGHVHVEHIIVVGRERQPLVIAREIEAVLLLRLEMRVTGLVLVLAVVVDAALKHGVDRTVLVQTIGEGKIQILLAVADG